MRALKPRIRSQRSFTSWTLAAALAGTLVFAGCTEAPSPAPGTDVRPIVNDGTIAVPPSPPATVTPADANPIKEGQPYSWHGIVGWAELEGGHYELRTACGSWALLPQTEAVAARLKAGLGQALTVWGQVDNAPGIVMRPAIRAGNAFGAGEPTVMLYVPEYPCGKDLPRPAPEPSPVPGSQPGTVYGRVSIGPMCPVEPCDRPAGDLYSSRQLVLTSSGGTMFIPLTADGQFKSLVKPDRYTASVSNCEFMGCKYALPKGLTVEEGQATYLELDIDTGIR